MWYNILACSKNSKLFVWNGDTDGFWSWISPLSLKISFTAEAWPRLWHTFTWREATNSKKKKKEKKALTCPRYSHWCCFLVWLTGSPEAWQSRRDQRCCVRGGSDQLQQTICESGHAAWQRQITYYLLYNSWAQHKAKYYLASLQGFVKQSESGV